MCGYKLFASSFSDASINPKMSAQHGCISFIELAAFSMYVVCVLYNILFFICFCCCFVVLACYCFISRYVIYYFLFVFVVVLLSCPAIVLFPCAHCIIIFVTDDRYTVTDARIAQPPCRILVQFTHLLYCLP